MSISRALACLLLAAIALTRPAAAAPAGQGVSQIRLDVREHVLKNGMKVLIVERHESPTVACYLHFKVGSANEYPGITGGSHLLEHMMFKGTPNVGTNNYAAEVPILKKIDDLYSLADAERIKLATGYGGGDPKKIQAVMDQIRKLQDEEKKYTLNEELWTLYLKHGGSGLNASTGEDYTNYYVSLPSNKIEMWAFLESDRIAHPIFREFYTERDVVYEERRMRVDNDADGQLFENFQSIAYSATPYYIPTTGWPSDLKTMRREDLERYFHTYYAPNNAIAVIVGDVHEADVMALMRKYFEPIPAQPKPRIVTTMDEPHTGERRVAVQFDANPSVYIGYLGGRLGTREYYCLDLLASILSGGRTGRLFKAIVEDKKLAADASASNYSRRLGNLFILSGQPLAPHTTAEVEQAIYEELERLKKEPVSQHDLDKVLNQMEANFVSSLESGSGLAQLLAINEHLTGSWKNYDERARYRAITPQDLMDVARVVFVDTNRTVATLVSRKPAPARNPAEPGK